MPCLIRDGEEYLGLSMGLFSIWYLLQSNSYARLRLGGFLMKYWTTPLALMAIAALGGFECTALAQARISTTGRVYPPAQQAKEQAASEGAEPVAQDEPAPKVGEAESPTDRATPQDDSLNLVCVGAGSANKTDTTTVTGSHSGTIMGSGAGFATYSGSSDATIVGHRSQAFADQVRVRLDDGDPRLRMPRTMLPLIRGGKDGWFKLKNVKYGRGEITASIAVNMFNNPKLRLDRYTGAISISGKAGDYTGQCQKFDPETVERAF